MSNRYKKWERERSDLMLLERALKFLDLNTGLHPIQSTMIFNTHRIEDIGKKNYSIQSHSAVDREQAIEILTKYIPVLEKMYICIDFDVNMCIVEVIFKHEKEKSDLKKYLKHQN